MEKSSETKIISEPHLSRGSVPLLNNVSGSMPQGEEKANIEIARQCNSAGQ
jgi:hypothetical protein